MITFLKYVAINVATNISIFYPSVGSNVNRDGSCLNQIYN